MSIFPDVEPQRADVRNAENGDRWVHLGSACLRDHVVLRLVTERNATNISTLPQHPLCGRLEPWRGRGWGYGV